jgi:hypothetical protein
METAMKTLVRLASIALAFRSLGASAQDGESQGYTGLSRTVTLVDGQTSEVRVRVSKPQKTVLTAITFPAPIREIVSAWNEKDLSVEHSGERLFIKLLAPSQGHLDAILTTGRHLRLYVVPVKDEDLYDANVLIQTDKGVAGPGDGTGRPEPRGAGSLELVRTMRLGEIPPGTTVRKGDGMRLFGTPDVAAKLSWVYESAFYRGYIVSLENSSAAVAYELDLPRIHSEDLVLVGARNLVVNPSSFTYLYLVFWKK